MKRLFISSIILIALLLALAVVLNAPRYAEARAHEAAAEAMQTQAVVTDITVAGMVLLGLLLTLALIATIAFFLWTSHHRDRALAAHWPQAPRRQLRPPHRHHLPAANQPTRYQLPMSAEDLTPPLDWQVWESAPWDIDNPY